MTNTEKIKLLIEIFNNSNPNLAKKITLNQEWAALFVGCSPNSLKNMRDDGMGPSYSQPGGEGTRVYYTKVALAEWLIDTETKTA